MSPLGQGPERFENDRPQRREGLAWREIDGLVVIVDPVTSTLHDLSDVASFYWLRLDGSHARDDLARLAVEEFEVESETARRDLDEFLDGLAGKGLLAE